MGNGLFTLRVNSRRISAHSLYVLYVILRG